MTGGRIRLGETFYEMVSPRTAFRSETVVVHGIMPSDVTDKPAAGAVGAAPAAGMALAFHGLFELLDRVTIPRGLRRER